MRHWNLAKLGCLCQPGYHDDDEYDIYGTIIFDENDVSLKIHNIKTNKVEPDINR